MRGASSLVIEASMVPRWPLAMLENSAVAYPIGYRSA